MTPSPERASTSCPAGYLVIDKPAGMTSHDVVAKLRKRLGERRVGHGGTLDPDATGVLVIALGQATRLLRYCTDLDKTYEGTLELGSTTTTLDASGQLTGTFEMSSVTVADVKAAASAFCGRIEQIPPMVSAVKVSGTRLYELARAGLEVERKPRSVVVKRFELEPAGAPSQYRFVVECSSGTYVRSLCADLGSALGGGAHLRELRRTRVGPFALADAVALEDVSINHIGEARRLVAHLDVIEVSAEIAARVLNGAVLGADELAMTPRPPWAVCTASGQLLAVYDAHREHLAKPALVLDRI